MASKVGSKGQVVIEKAIRDALAIAPGSIAVQRQVGDHVEMWFLPPEHDASLMGILAEHVTRPVSDEALEEAIEAAAAQAAVERFQRTADG